MARFRYLGETPRPGITYGPCKQIKLKKKDGTTQTLLPVPPETEFPVGEDIGHDITDQMSLLQMRPDTRFQEIV
jgi:hypothetical protein